MRIRTATTDDYQKVIDLITELAIFEKAGNQVTNTAKQMFEEKDYFKCLVAENDENEIIGFALYFYAYFTWIGKSLYLDDLFVKKEYRNQGVAKKFLNEIFEDARRENCKRVRWQVLDWNTDAIEFYKKIGAKLDNEWINCDYNKEEIEKFKV